MFDKLDKMADLYPGHVRIMIGEVREKVSKRDLRTSAHRLETVDDIDDLHRITECGPCTFALDSVGRDLMQHWNLHSDKVQEIRNGF